MEKLSKRTKIILVVLIVAVLICCIFLLSQCGSGQTEADSSGDTQQTEEITTVTDLANAVVITEIKIEKDVDDEGLNGIMVSVYYNVPQLEADFSDHQVELSVVYPDVYASAFDSAESRLIEMDTSPNDGTYMTMSGLGEYSIDVTEAMQDEIVAQTEAFKVRIYADGAIVQELSYDDIMK